MHVNWIRAQTSTHPCPRVPEPYNKALAQRAKTRQGQAVRVLK
jgi:hypothetical protein